MELREKFILAEGVSQSMAGFVSKSPAGSSGSSASGFSGTASWSSRTGSTTSGPITKIREKSQHTSPWRQRVKTSPDGEVRQIMSRVQQDGSRLTKTKITRDMRSPASRSSSRASTSSRNGSRPPSRTGSDVSEPNDPEVFTTMKAETKNIGGRNQTTVTYQTHVAQTRTVTMPTATTTTRTPTGARTKIPKLTPKRK